MKKYWLILFAFMACITFIACGGKSPTDIGNNKDENDDEDEDEYVYEDRRGFNDDEYDYDRRGFAADARELEPIREVPAIIEEREIVRPVEEKVHSIEQIVTEAPAEVERPPIEKPFDVVEVMPSFPGGQAELMKFLAANINYPTVAQENGIQGRVVVKFVVEHDGSISNAVVVKSVDPSLDNEALRVVRAMPRWTPGMNNGQSVRVNFNVPVSFKLQ